MSQSQFPEWMGEDPRRGANWSKREDNHILLTIRNGMPIAAIAASCGRTSLSIISRLQQKDPIFRRYDESFDGDVDACVPLSKIYTDYRDELSKSQVDVMTLKETVRGLKSGAQSEDKRFLGMRDSILEEVSSRMTANNKLFGLVTFVGLIIFSLVVCYFN